nr:hypothetical protein [Clostridium sp. CM74B_53]
MVKVQRSYPAPESLEIEAQKPNGSYSCDDVVERLKDDFHNKCYICEIDQLQDPQIEHLLPHMNGKYVQRKFDWNNLFWACGHCNNVKNQKKYQDGIIDCCKEDPEERLSFELENEEVKVEAIDKEDKKAILTAELIMEVFNLKNTGMRVYKSEHRYKELNLEMNILYDALEELKKSPKSAFLSRKVQALLRRESRFAAFKRNYIRDNKGYYPESEKWLK